MLSSCRISVCFIVSMLSLVACQENGHPRLVWSDEFDYTGAPDSTRWDYDLGAGNPDGWGNNEQEFYTKDLKNVRVENGRLIIEAHKDSLQHKAFTSTRLISKKKGDWLYAKIEVKAKLPHGKGTWPAIWMLPTDWKYGNWPTSGEIDIMEHVGYDPGVIHGTIHTEAYNHTKQTQKEGKVTIQNTQNEFHVYAIDWTENKIDFFVDDQLYHTVIRDPKDDFKGWPFDQRFHLIMNIAVGGNWGGKEGVDENIWPQRMEVEYVRVYQ
jgi:beta-glucanase (GH16 family)